MDIFTYFLFGTISLIASVVGSICGIGGGVIIKPALDAFGILSVASISFLSGCTVLSMSCYSIVKSKLSGDSLIDTKIGTPLAIGSAIGGIIGKNLFIFIASLSANENRIGAVQAGCLFFITLGTLLYTINKDKIITHKIDKYVYCVLIGLFLGIISSFLGIGGGPINLVVLFYFFSMDTKTAAQNSLYIILFSQATSLLSTILTNEIPTFSILLLIMMVICGIVGGIIGRKINEKIDINTVSKIFIIVMILIMLINIYNFAKYII